MNGISVYSTSGTGSCSSNHWDEIPLVAELAEGVRTRYRTTGRKTLGIECTWYVQSLILESGGTQRHHDDMTILHCCVKTFMTSWLWRGQSTGVSASLLDDEMRLTRQVPCNMTKLQLIKGTNC